MIHVPVLLNEVVEGLDLQEGDLVIDGTLGDGGHSEAILSQNQSTKVIAFDLDSTAILRAQARLEKYKERVTYVNASFKTLSAYLEKVGIEKVDKVLFDFGFSSFQVDSSERGFSFQKNEPLLMTFQSSPVSQTLTARDVVNDWSEESLREIIKGFGEERFAGRIARGIVESRQMKLIETTGDLVEIILSSTPKSYHHGKIHPATRTFQAIRIAVNDELTAIKEGLTGALKHLTPNGRIVAISFHSLEDRIVKNFFRDWAKSEEGVLITKKPITASEEEKKANPRSRSAKLRVFQKI